MLIAAIILIGIMLTLALALAVVRRSDATAAVGVLSRETRHADRSRAAEGPAPTGWRFERQAALERQGGVACVAVAEPASRTLVRGAPPPVDVESLGVTRRQFLNRAVLGVFGLGLTGFGAAVLAFLYPVLNAGGFGSVINIGPVTDIRAAIATKQPYYSSSARAYINPYPAASVPKAKAAAYAEPILAGMALGFVALYQKCPHLGCRVPWCQTSQWFECPCHGSQYNRVGEKKGGPAPRGMDRFALSVGSDGTMTINTETVFLGPPIGTNTTGQEAEGPHCH